MKSCFADCVTPALQKYPLSEILVVADNDERYGENWVVYLTEAAFRAKMDVRVVEHALGPLVADLRSPSCAGLRWVEWS
jgi:hypothetical protein